jgi:hypothetical protein
VLSKLRQAPRLIEAARENIKEPPAMFVKVGLETLRGVMTFIDSDLPKAFSSLDDLHLLADLADASQEAVHSIGSYVEYLENEMRPARRRRSGSASTSSSRSFASMRASRFP